MTKRENYLDDDTDSDELRRLVESGQLPEGAHQLGHHVLDVRFRVADFPPTAARKETAAGLKVGDNGTRLAIAARKKVRCSGRRRGPLS